MRVWCETVEGSMWVRCDMVEVSLVMCQTVGYGVKRPRGQCGHGVRRPRGQWVWCGTVEDSMVMVCNGRGVNVGMV